MCMEIECYPASCVVGPRDTPAHQIDTGAWLLTFPVSKSASRGGEPPAVEQEGFPARLGSFAYPF